VARICVPPEAISGGRLTLGADALRHVRTVLRLRAGDELVVTDGEGAEYVARLERLGRDRGEAALVRRAGPGRESPLRTVLAQAVPKGDRFELALQKAVELGVSAVVPLLTGRTVPAPRRAGGVRLERWRRVAEGAVAQCGRTRLPAVHPPRAFSALVADPAPEPLRVLLWAEAPEGLGAVLAAWEEPPKAVLVAAGPEGGWEPGEAESAIGAGFRPARLGPRTLRSETAGLAALAVLQHRWGDLR